MSEDETVDIDSMHSFTHQNVPLLIVVVSLKTGAMAMDTISTLATDFN